MYTITKTPCPERERTWLLSIDGHQMGVVEVVHMTDTLRSVAGQFNAFTKDFDQISVAYDCDKATHRTSYSINNFIADIQAAIGEQELHIPRSISDDAPEQIYVAADVNESNVDTVVEMMRIETPLGWNNQTQFQKVGYIQAFLLEERAANMACPMRDLVQKAKLAKTRATPIPVHMKKHW